MKLTISERATLMLLRSWRCDKCGNRFTAIPEGRVQCRKCAGSASREYKVVPVDDTVLPPIDPALRKLPKLRNL